MALLVTANYHVICHLLAETKGLWHSRQVTFAYDVHRFAIVLSEDCSDCHAPEISTVCELFSKVLKMSSTISEASDNWVDGRPGRGRACVWNRAPSVTYPTAQIASLG